VISAAKRPLAVIVPQSGDDVGDNQIRRVLSDELQYENAVLAKVRLGEDGRGPSVAVARLVVAVGDLKMSADVQDAAVSEADRPEPACDADDGRGGDAGQPEPEERVDLLVKEVDGQDAMNGVPVHRAHLSDVEVAQRHARKSANNDAVGGSDGGPTGNPDTTAGGQVDEHLEAVGAVVGGQEGVDEEDLGDGVGEVEKLGDNVKQ